MENLSWIKTGGICGVLALIAYFSAAFLALPDTAGYLAAFSFGPLISLASVGLYHSLGFHKKTPLLQAGTLLSIGGGFMVLLMLCVQQSTFVVLGRLKEGMDQSIYLQVFDSVNSVQLGMDVAWDMLIASGNILFALAMVRHPAYGKLIGGAGIILNLLLLGFNLYYFPIPPAESNSIDWGPFVAIWMGTVYGMMAWSYHKLTTAGNRVV